LFELLDSVVLELLLDFGLEDDSTLFELLDSTTLELLLDITAFELLLDFIAELEELFVSTTFSMHRTDKPYFLLMLST
jgi:hypothetical protein